MTPGARVAAAIEVLDTILGGAPAEQSLTTWARQNRYAGSKDRAAVRDHVFDALRCRRSFAAAGGADTGRGLMIGALRVAGKDPDTLFNGQGYAPPQLDTQERITASDPLPSDVPEWLEDQLMSDLGTGYAAYTDHLRHRAPVDLRVNTARATLIEAAAHLAADGIVVSPVDGVPTALRVLDGARKVAQSKAYQAGLVELQDAGAQRICNALPLTEGSRVLDLCAGGGGKALALAARAPGARIAAWDISQSRLGALAPRAQRAGARISLLTDPPDGQVFDLVIADVPCSGSGTWRRGPDAKWRLTADRLRTLVETQQKVLAQAAGCVAPEGTLAYITCSVLRCENQDQVKGFLKTRPHWSQTREMVLDMGEASDGFYCAQLTNGP